MRPLPCLLVKSRQWKQVVKHRLQQILVRQPKRQNKHQDQPRLPQSSIPPRSSTFPRICASGRRSLEGLWRTTPSSNPPPPRLLVPRDLRARHLDLLHQTGYGLCLCLCLCLCLVLHLHWLFVSAVPIVSLFFEWSEGRAVCTVVLMLVYLELRSTVTWQFWPSIWP